MSFNPSTLICIENYVEKDVLESWKKMKSLKRAIEGSNWCLKLTWLGGDEWNPLDSTLTGVVCDDSILWLWGMESILCLRRNEQTKVKNFHWKYNSGYVKASWPGENIYLCLIVQYMLVNALYMMEGYLVEITNRPAYTRFQAHIPNKYKL